MRGLAPLAAAALAVPGLAASSAPSGALELRNLHSGESLALVRDAAGGFGGEGLLALRHLLRDHRDGLEHDIDPALPDLLVAVADRCRRPPRFEVISGYRSPDTNAALRAGGHGVSVRSLHMQGMAIDVRLAGCPLAQLRAAALGLARGGVGYYPGPGFVHLDTGRVRSWAE